MSDTNSAAFLGFMLLLFIILIGVGLFFILKKFINKYLTLLLISVGLGLILGELHPYNYIFYLAAVVCLILFVIDLVKKKSFKAEKK